MTEAGTGPCDIAASCLCGGAFVQAGNLPADGVLQATVVSSYVATITATYGDTSGFATGDSICVNQSAVGATILVPVQNAGDAAHVTLVPDGETCVPNYAYTVQLDDGGRPLACNAGVESQIPLSTQQAIDALRAQDCTASLAAVDTRWGADACGAPGGGCSTSPFDAAGTSAALVGLVTMAMAVRLGRRVSSRRGPPRGSSACRASTRR